MVLIIEHYKDNITTLIEVNNIILEKNKNSITIVGLETKTLNLNEFDNIEIIKDGKILLSYKCIPTEKVEKIKGKLNEKNNL